MNINNLKNTAKNLKAKMGSYKTKSTVPGFMTSGLDNLGAVLVPTDNAFNHKDSFLEYSNNMFVDDNESLPSKAMNHVTFKDS